MSKRKKKPRTPANRRKTGGAVSIVEAGKATRFQPGQSGNLSGRPKKTPYTDACRTVAEMRVKNLKAKSTDTVPIAVAKALARKAIAGKVQAAAEIANRAEGRPTQRHEIGGPDGTAAKVEANFSIDNLFAAIRIIYGLDPESR
jgi:hypothetical protein